MVSNCEKITIYNSHYIRLYLLDASGNNYIHLPINKQKACDTLQEVLIKFSIEHRIKWDNTNATDALKQQSHFYKRLAAEDLLFIPEAGKRRKNPLGNSSGSSAGTTTITTANGGTKQVKAGGYKTLGPQSIHIPANALFGTPQNKSAAPSGTMFWITSDKLKTNTPRLYVTPVNEPNATPPIKADMADSDNLKAKWGSGNGYADCTCFFADRNEAEEICDALRPSLQSKGYQNIRVEAKNIKEQGYMVRVKVGHLSYAAFIGATKLNEELTEDCEDNAGCE